MQDLFIVRHGDYGPDQRISDLGKEQMKELGGLIHETIPGKMVYICSSTAGRAADSARVLARALRLLPNDYEKIEYLWSGTDSPLWQQTHRDPDPYVIFKIVNERREKAPGLILVTHDEIAAGFPAFFYEKEFSVKVPEERVRHGQAAHINLEQRTYEIIGRK